MVTISRAEYESLKAERDELSQKLDWLLEQVRLSRKKLYGSSSERLEEELMGQLSLMFDETEAWVSKRRSKETKVAAHTRRSSRLEEVLPDNVPVEVVEHRIPENELDCPVCGTTMMEIGKDVRRTLVMIPAQVKIREDVYFTYACPKCKEEGTETPIRKAERLPALIPDSYASPEAVAHHHGAEICDARTIVPAGEGVEPGRRAVEQADHEQLGAAGGGGLVETGI